MPESDILTRADGDALRLADANLLRSLCALERRLNKIENFLCRAALVRALEREEREARTKERKYQAICDLAAHLGPGRPEQVAERIERLFNGSRQPVPAELVLPVEKLRHAYGNGGPSRQTMRRAFQFFQRGEKRPGEGDHQVIQLTE